MDSATEIECLVFSSSLKSKKDVSRISDTMNNFEGILDWNFDLEDWEKVLRVEVVNIEAHQIISLLKTQGVFLRQMET